MRIMASVNDALLARTGLPTMITHPAFVADPENIMCAKIPLLMIGHVAGIQACNCIINWSRIS